MKKLKDLTFGEFEELVKFLKGISKHKEFGEVKGVNQENEFVLSNLRRFIPALPATGDMKFSLLLSDMTYANWEIILDEFGDLDYDETGRSTVRTKEYWEVTLETLEKLYEMAENTGDNHVNNQIIEAKRLSWLKNKKYSGYAGIRKLTVAKHPIINEYRLQPIEIYLKNEFGKEKAILFLTQFLGYCWENRKGRSLTFFINHILSRFECLIADKDNTKTENIEFRKNVESVIKQYFINETISEVTANEKAYNS